MFEPRESLQSRYHNCISSVAHICHQRLDVFDLPQSCSHFEPIPCLCTARALLVTSVQKRRRGAIFHFGRFCASLTRYLYASKRKTIMLLTMNVLFTAINLVPKYHTAVPTDQAVLASEDNPLDNPPSVVVSVLTSLCSHLFLLIAVHQRFPHRSASSHHILVTLNLQRTNTFQMTSTSSCSCPSSLPTGILIAITVGAVIVIDLLVIIAIWLYKRAHPKNVPSAVGTSSGRSQPGYEENWTEVSTLPPGERRQDSRLREMMGRDNRGEQ